MQTPATSIEPRFIVMNPDFMRKRGLKLLRSMGILQKRAKMVRRPKQRAKRLKCST